MSFKGNSPFGNNSIPDDKPVNTFDQKLMIFQYLELTADLLALGLVFPAEYFKLKQMLKSPDTETVKLAKNIIDGKAKKKS